MKTRLVLLALALSAAAPAAATAGCGMRRRHASLPWSSLSPLQQARFAGFRDAQRRADWDALPEDVRMVYFTVTRALEKAPGNLLARVRRVTDIRGAQWTYEDAWASGEPGVDCVSEPRRETRGHHFELDLLWEPGSYEALDPSGAGSAYVARRASFLHADELSVGEEGVEDSAGLHLLFAKTASGAGGVIGHAHIDYRGISAIAGLKTLGEERVRAKIRDLLGADLSARSPFSLSAAPGQRDPAFGAVPDPALQVNRALLSPKRQQPRREPLDREGHLRESGADPLAIGPAAEQAAPGETAGPIDNLERFKRWFGDERTDAAVDQAVAAARR
jgi:hypothetical protein